MAKDDSTFEMSKKVARQLKEDKADVQITKGTLLPVSLVATIVVGIVSLVWTYAQLTHKVESVQAKVEAHDKSLQEDIKGWLRVFKATNQGKGISIPDWEE